jgi:hypothetical protein
LPIKYDRYDNVIASSDKLEFQFTSVGPKGEIKKIVQFTRLGDTGIYNLSFGNFCIDGSIDDETTNNNKDRNKILATVAASVYEFTALHPETMIFFKGITLARTRLYRMAITINYKEIRKDFKIYGISHNGTGLKVSMFKKGIDYVGFLIKRKKHNFKV